MSLLVYPIVPIVLGSGKRLFPEESWATLQLVESKTFDTGVGALVYRSLEKAP